MTTLADINARLANLRLPSAPAQQPHTLKLKLTPPAPAPAAHTVSLHLSPAAAPAPAPPPKKLSFLHVNAPGPAAPAAAPSADAAPVAVGGAVSDAGTYAGGDGAAEPMAAATPSPDAAAAPADTPAAAPFAMTPTLWALAGLGGLAVVAIVVSARSGYSMADAR